MSMIVSICQHCDEEQFRNTCMCILHDFLSGKVRFVHTSTIIKAHSCSEQTTNTARMHLVTYVSMSMSTFFYAST